MKTLSFRMDPYLHRDGSENPDWKMLCLYADDEKIASSEVNLYYWNDATPEEQDEVRFNLTLRIWKEIGKELGTDRTWGPKYAFSSVEEYQKWYEWMWFVDGEDAKEYLRNHPQAKHAKHFQTRMGAEVGWKYFKVLKEHDFIESVASLLAYTRGYLAGMEANSLWNSEGMEALHCLGLDVLEPLGSENFTTRDAQRSLMQ